MIDQSESKKAINGILLILMFSFIAISAFAGANGWETINVLFFIIGIVCAVFIAMPGGE